MKQRTAAAAGSTLTAQQLKGKPAVSKAPHLKQVRAAFCRADLPDEAMEFMFQLSAGYEETSNVVRLAAVCIAICSK